MKYLFSGSYTHTLDAKGRISFPARFREGLGGRVYVTRGTDSENKYLWVFSGEKWEEMVRKLNELPKTAQAQRVRRHLIGNAHLCEIDRLGRIQVPAPLREFSALEKEVVIMGIGDSIEMWNKSKKVELDDRAEESGEIQKDMEELGI